MRKWSILLAMMLVLLVVGIAISAQDDGVTTDDNWCLEGQPWENTCGGDNPGRTEWLWTCGWYFAQAQLGNTRWAPWWCATQMPAAFSCAMSSAPPFPFTSRAGAYRWR